MSLKHFSFNNLRVKCIIYFEFLLCKMWYLGRRDFCFILFCFPIWVHNHSSSVCYKGCLSFIELVLHLCQNLVEHLYMSLFLGSLFFALVLSVYASANTTQFWVSLQRSLREILFCNFFLSFVHCIWLSYQGNTGLKIWVGMFSSSVFWQRMWFCCIFLIIY